MLKEFITAQDVCNTLNEMLTVLKDKVENYDEALGKIKKTNYEELLF